MISFQHNRREFLKSSIGLVGLTLPTFLKARTESVGSRIPHKAKSCIIVYTWGGMSHYESFDPKPEAPADIRGPFGNIPTKTPGIRFCEYLPKLAHHSEQLAVVRSVHHKHGGHQQGMYINLTGKDLCDRHTSLGFGGLPAPVRKPCGPESPAAYQQPFVHSGLDARMGYFR